MTTEKPNQEPTEQPREQPSDIPAEAVPAEQPTAATQPDLGSADAPAADAPAADAPAAETQGPVVQDLSDLAPAEAAAIAAVAVDTTLVRVPKLGAFLRAGALVGVVVGLILGFWMSAPSLINRWIFITLTVVFVTLVVGLLAAGLYVYLDKRARAKAHR